MSDRIMELSQSCEYGFHNRCAWSVCACDCHHRGSEISSEASSETRPDRLTEIRQQVPYRGEKSWRENGRPLRPTARDDIEDLLEMLTPAPCVMKHEQPMDFAYCETHDTTFPLGGVCKFKDREPWQVYADEADEQRQRAVKAEMRSEVLNGVTAQMFLSYLDVLSGIQVADGSTLMETVLAENPGMKNRLKKALDL